MLVASVIVMVSVSVPRVDQYKANRHRPVTLDMRHGLGHLLPYCCLMLMDKIPAVDMMVNDPILYRVASKRATLWMNAAILERFLLTKNPAWKLLHATTKRQQCLLVSLVLWVLIPAILASSENHTGTVVECWPPQAQSLSQLQVSIFGTAIIQTTVSFNHSSTEFRVKVLKKLKEISWKYLPPSNIKLHLWPTLPEYSKN